MNTTADSAGESPKKSKKAPLFIGLLLALVGGGGGFMAVQSGILSADKAFGSDRGSAAPTAQPLDVAFVALDPLVISLPATQGRQHLRFAAQLEVPLAHVAEVEAIKPRIVDILNGYLRAVDLAELENPAALLKLRSHMLRRVQIVTGDGRVNDLLIMEFVLS